jgi:hypothetical protein
LTPEDLVANAVRSVTTRSARRVLVLGDARGGLLEAIRARGLEPVTSARPGERYRVIVVGAGERGLEERTAQGARALLGRRGHVVAACAACSAAHTLLVLSDAGLEPKRMHVGYGGDAGSADRVLVVAAPAKRGGLEVRAEQGRS